MQEKEELSDMTTSLAAKALTDVSALYLSEKPVT